MADGLHVLIVDDHALIRRALVLLLRDWIAATDVIEAGTIDEAVAAVAAHPRVDLALIDLRLPGTVGLEGIRRFMSAHRDVPVAIISGHADPSLVEAALAMGVRGLILKSAKPEVFRSAIELIRSGEIYVPSELMLARPDSLGGGAESGGPNSRALAGLSARQRDVLRHLARGRSNKEIARLLQMNEGTVKLHVTAILRQLGVKNRTEAALLAARVDLGEDDDGAAEPGGAR